MADIKQIGLDLGIYGPLAEPEIVINLAKYAETAGFSSIWLADHVVSPKHFDSKYPYSATGGFPAPIEDPLLEPIATMAVLAGSTTDIRIGTAVLIIPYRNPVLLARMLITIDQFSLIGAGVTLMHSTEKESVYLASKPFKMNKKSTELKIS